MDIVTTYTPKDAAEAHAKATGGKATRIPGGWKVKDPDGKVVHYMNRTKWFRGRA